MPKGFLSEFMKKKNAPLFILSVALPFLLILFSFLKTDWTWGLIDDVQNLTRSTSGHFWDVYKEFTTSYFKDGRVQWSLPAYLIASYKIFANHPKFFYIFKWLQIAGMLFVWGALAYGVTRKKESFFIMPAVALSFRLLYPQFFIVKYPETQQLLLFGLAFWAVVYAEFFLRDNRQLLFRRWACWFLAIVALILTSGIKETCVAGIIALGIAVFWLGISRRFDRGMLVLGTGIVVCALVFGLYLKFVISRENTYSGAYSLTNYPMIVHNLMLWAKETLRHHMLWIIMAGWIFWRTGGLPTWSSYSQREQFALVLGSTLYFSEVAVLLPWYAGGYYVATLGVYFAFLFTVITAHRWEKLKDELVTVLMVFVLVYNLYISYEQLYYGKNMSTDVQNLGQYIKGNESFQNNDLNGKVYCNSQEAAETIHA